MKESLHGSRKVDQISYNISKFYADLLRSLRRQPDGEDFKLTYFVVAIFDTSIQCGKWSHLWFQG